MKSAWSEYIHVRVVLHHGALCSHEISLNNARHEAQNLKKLRENTVSATEDVERPWLAGPGSVSGAKICRELDVSFAHDLTLRRN